MCYVNFNYLDHKDKVLRSCKDEPCYSNITYGTLPKETAKLELWQTKNEIPFTKDEIKQWIEDIADMGFPCEYKGLSGTKHSFIIPIKTDKEQVYSEKRHLSSALMLVRYLFEFPQIPKNYFIILKEVKNVDKFAAMQIAHVYCSGNSNHTIREFEPQTVMSRGEAAKMLHTKQYSIYNNPHPSITASWKGARLAMKVLDDHAKMYNKIMEKDELPIKVYVVGGDTNYANWMPNVKVVKTLEAADLVLFTGGEDVDPSMYDEPMGKWTGSNLHRDVAEKKIFDEALAAKKKMIGICRGSQFLCVMAGGKLVQHQSNPYRVHEISLKRAFNNLNKVQITSTHHQAAFPYNLPAYKFEVLGYTQMLDSHLGGNNKELVIKDIYGEKVPFKECEIVRYPYINAIGIQGHPEFADYQKNYPDDLKAFKEIFNEFINNKL